MVSCCMCMQSVFFNLIILIWSLLLDGFFISENRGIKEGLVYCELEGWILPLYSFFTGIGIILASIQIIHLIACCGCREAREYLRVRSYSFDLIWAIVKEVPQLSIILYINICRDGWFKTSSLCKAIFTICVTMWKLYNLYTFVKQDIKSEHIPKCCREKRLYICYPAFLLPVWSYNLILSLSITILFIHRHRGSGFIQIPGSIHQLKVQDKYLYTKYIERSGIYLHWPDGKLDNAYMKLAEIDYIMANRKTTVRLGFHLPYVCFERSLYDRTPSQCFEYDSQRNNLKPVSNVEFSHSEQNATFTFHYHPPSNLYNLGQITYDGHVNLGNLFFDELLYFRLHQPNAHDNDDDFLHRNQSHSYEFYQVNRQLIPIERAWRYGLGKCRPCVSGPKLSKN